MQNQSDDDNPIKIINVQNTLKQRAVGIHRKEAEEGFIDPELIDAAEKEIKISCNIAGDVINKDIKSIMAAWDKIHKLETKNPVFTETSKDMYLVAHNIKDVAAQCGFTLIAFFAESLRDFLDEKSDNVKAQKIIVQAHIDALSVCNRNGYKEDGGEKAEELKAMVKKAIDQYT